MDALCGCCLSFIADHTVLPVFRHCGYMIKYKSNISDLEAQIQKLEDRRVAVKKQVVAAEENLETVLSEVERWLFEVEAIIEKKEKMMIFEEQNVSKALCCYGWCMNPKACHYLGRKAKKMTFCVNDLRSIGNFTTIAYISTTLGRNCGAGALSGPSCPAALESRASVSRDVLEALKCDDSSPVIIFGMSGIGKTTMLKEIYKSEEASSLFDKVLLVEVNREEDYLHKLQTEIASSLGLKRLSEHTSLVERAKMLSKRLMSQKVLVMLDDVWERIDFEEAGIPLCRDCKVLISTRFQHLYREVAPERKFIINGLTHEEAWSLFKEMAGNVIESGWLKPIAEKIVRKCDGLPIAITTIGRALHSKGEGIWNDVLRRLENPSPENVSEEEVVKKVFRKIEFCFNCLHSKEAKSFFFLCCIYPEGSDIQVDDLVRHGLGLGLFKNISSMVEGRNRVEALIDRLKDRSLLLDSNKKGCVKMHDLVRKVALLLDSSMSHKRDGVIITRNRLELISKCVRFHEVSGSRENQILLSCSDDSKQQRGAILKVLDCKRISLAQPLFNRLKTIQTLCFEHCHLVDVSIIGKLKLLTILSLRHSSMNELPQSLRNLSNLWLLDLTGCKIPNPEIISSGIISGLKKLQELYMLVHRSHEEFIPQKVEERDEVVSELLSWQCSLTTFEADLPEVNLKSLQRTPIFDKLERFKISIGCSGRWDMVPSHYNCLRLNVDADTRFVGSELTKLLWKANTLEIAMNILEGECFNGLKCLKFEGGRTLNDIILNILGGAFTANLKHALRSLTIKSSKMLSSHCIGQIPNGIFHELRRVELHSCPSLSSLFTLSMDKWDINLHQLEELDIRACSELKQIFVNSEGEIQYKNRVFELPNLIRLELVDLKDFVGFSSVSINFPLLINIQLGKLPKLVSLYPNDTAPSSSTATTQHLFDAEGASLLELRFVKVFSCDLISNMFSSHSMQSLQNLEDLIVKDCQSLRVLFNFADANIKTKNTSSTLSCLTNMNLIGLPKLEHIWKPHKRIQAFQRLKSVRIDRCDLLKNVFPCYIAEGLVELEEFCISDCAQMREIIYIDKESGDREFEASSSKRKIVFSRVRMLELRSLPSLVRFIAAHCVLEWPLLKKLVLADLQRDIAGINFYAFCEMVYLTIPEELSLSNMPKLLVVVPLHMQHRVLKLEVLSVSDCELVTEIFESRDVSILETNALLITGDVRGPGYRNLRVLNVSMCNSLRALLSHSVATSLERLEELSVCSCRNIEQIILKPAEGEESEINTNILPNLALLSLTDLPNITCLTEGKYNLEWRFLSKFKLWGCADMRTFCFGSAHTLKPLTMELSVDRLRQVSFRDLNLIISRIYRGESSL